MLNGQRSTSNLQLALSIERWTLGVKRWTFAAYVWRSQSFVRLKSTKTYLRPPPGYRFRAPWYLRPWFYVPVAAAVVIGVFLTVFVASLVADLKAQARTF